MTSLEDTQKIYIQVWGASTYSNPVELIHVLQNIFGDDAWPQYFDTCDQKFR
jgi:hypothetical protein